MRNYKHILSITLLVAALAYSLWFVFAGFGNHQDPLYWLYKYEHLEGGWMAVGTLLTGGAIVKLFGAQLVWLRLFGWLCTVTAISLPFVCLLDKEQRRENIHWLALTYILMGYGAFQEFSPGTLSVLLLSALWVTSVSRSPFASRLSPILLGLAVAARFPNVLALLVLVPLWKKRSLWNIPIAAVAAGVVYLLGWWLVTPAATDAAMTSSHELLSMFTKLWENGGKLVGYLLMAAGVLAFREKKYTGWLAGGALVLVIVYTMKPLQWYNTDLTYLLSALALALSVSGLSTFHRPLLVGAAVLSVATLGTDTAWLKLFPAVLCLLPVALTQYKTVAEQRYLYEMLVVLCVVVVLRMTHNSVGQSDLTKVQTFSSVSPYKGIAIREIEEERMMQYKADFDSLIAPNPLTPNPLILSIGQEMHLMRAVTGCEAARYNEFWSNIFDSVYTVKYRDIIEAERPIVFCSFSPQFRFKPRKDKESMLENMLREHGYREIDRSKYKYMIYIPQSSNRQSSNGK